MIEEIQNRKNLDLCEELFAEAFVNHTPPQGIAADRNGMRQDGKITEHWNVVDRLDLYRQLGLVRANERQES